MQCFPMNFSRGAVNLIPSTAQRRRWFEIVISGLIIPTYLLFLIFRQWQPAKPRTGMSFFNIFWNNFQPNFQFSNRCHDMSCTDVAICLERSISVFLACGHQTLPGRFTEVFLHVRCIPSVFDKLFLGKCVLHTGFVKVV